MDMSGVELSVANAHLQVQRVEDEVIKEMKVHMEDYEAKTATWSGVLQGRVDDLELARDRTNEKCDTVREVLTSWMVTFEALEKSIGATAEDVKTIEDWLTPNSRCVAETQEQIKELSDLVKDQASTIRLLQGRVGELELGHGVLWTRVANIEVGR
jgi:methyl-accepting chemotaxis protein